MLRLGILAIFLLTCSLTSASALSQASASNNVIHVYETASKTIRLKSVLSLLNAVTTTRPTRLRDNAVDLAAAGRHKQQKIFWSFKRIYAMPNWTGEQTTQTTQATRTLEEVSPVELMISLDAEVQDNLQSKFSTSNDSEADSMYDLTVFNLTYADSGIYKCNLWNQKTIYYKLIVSSTF